VTAPRQFDIGGVRLTLASGGINWMDGGSMFGIVPRSLWETWYPPDDFNRIRLDTNCLVVETGGQRILLESGCGNKLDAKERGFYGAKPGDWIAPNLEAAGFPLDSIDVVGLTHLHTDHAGGVVSADSNGKFYPTFPKAIVHIGSREHDHAEKGYGISPNAYDPNNYRPLKESGRLKIAGEEAALAGNIRFHSTPGHTKGHQSFLLTGTLRSVLFTGDLFPLFRQAVPHFNMAYDVDPVQKSETKTAILQRAYEERWILVLSHEPETPICEVEFNQEKSRYEFRPVPLE
jgi:glyoxylase-like metal-dependent hydrolase (beta-lactamase superfamily II)